MWEEKGRKWIIAQNVNAKTIKHLEESIRKCLSDLGVGKKPLRSLEAITINFKNNQSNVNKLKMSAYQKMLL